MTQPDRLDNPEPWCEDRADPSDWSDPDIIDTPEEGPDAVAH